MKYLYTLIGIWMMLHPFAAQSAVSITHQDASISRFEMHLGEGTLTLFHTNGSGDCGTHGESPLVIRRQTVGAEWFQVMARMVMTAFKKQLRVNITSSAEDAGCDNVTQLDIHR